MSNLLLFQDRYPDEDENALARFHSGHYQFVGFVGAVDKDATDSRNNLVGARPMGVSDILVDPEKMTLMVLGRESIVEVPFDESAQAFRAASPFKG